nr:hypothetical protein [Anaerolineae bacterium]
MKDDKRPGLWPALLAFCLSVLFAMGALLTWLAFSPLPSGESLGYVDLSSDKSVGVNGDLYGLESEDLEQVLVAIDRAGFRWLRQRFPWDAIETSPGEYNWSASDAIVSAAAGHDLELIAVLDGSPSWARAEVDAGNSLAPPVDTRGFGDFVSAFATRYGGRVACYQIWDEPNIAPHWGAREIDPAAYVRLLREGSIRVRAADGDAVVLFAALAPNVESGGQNMSDLLFLDAAYQQGAAEWFDLLGAQPYGFDSPITAQPDAGELNWRRVELLREVMLSHADGGTAVWAVSFGVPVPDVAGVAEAVELARKEWPWMGAMLWAAITPGDHHGQYALLDDSGEPNATSDALQQATLLPELAWPGVY